MVSFFDIFIYWVFFLALTISLTQAGKKITSGLSLLFTFSVFSIGLWGLQSALYSTRIVIDYEIICTFLIPVTFFAAASNPLRYQWLIQTGYHLDWRYYLLFIPCALSILFVSPLLLHPGSATNEYLKFSPLVTGRFLNLPLYYMLLQMLYPLSKLYQAILASVILIRYSGIVKEKSGGLQNRISSEAFKAELFITCSIFTVMIGDIFSLRIVKFSLIGCALALFSTFLNSMKYPIYNKLMRFEIDKIKQTSSKIKTLDIDSVIDRLTYIMEKEKAFAVESIALKDLADELEISVHQLSEILNKKLGKNFNSYINEYRINEAKEMLINEPDRSVISIGTAVGFNAISSFTSVFTRVEGCSPREYRKISAVKNRKNH